MWKVKNFHIYPDVNWTDPILDIVPRPTCPCLGTRLVLPEVMVLIYICV